MEDLPHPCYAGAGSGNYAKKHDPFMYFRAIARDPSQCSHVVPLSAARARRARSPARALHLDHAEPVPRHARLQHRHRRPVPARSPPQLLAALGRRGLLILTWDEGSSDDGCCRLAAGGHIVTILAGPAVRPAARLNTPVDHYSMLQLVEDLFGLPRRGGAACACTPSLAPLLRSH